jgi:DNA invertase Pin-like site-specific DNA recombinase
VKAAVYARVSTSNGSQTCENQLLELRRYCEARGWVVYAEYTDEMSGAKDRRPGLDRLLLDARRARVQVVVCWALDRIGRDLKHLLAVLEDLQSLNIPFVSLKEGLDLGSASGRLQLAILAALSQFERERLKERTIAGLERARAQGKRLGRPSEPIPVGKLEAVKGISVREGARRLGVARSTLQRWRALARQNPSVQRLTFNPHNPGPPRTSGVARSFGRLFGPVTLVFCPVDLTRMSPYISRAERVGAFPVRTCGWSEEVYRGETNRSRLRDIGGGFGRKLNRPSPIDRPLDWNVEGQSGEIHLQPWPEADCSRDGQNRAVGGRHQDHYRRNECGGPANPHRDGRKV